MSHHKLLFFFTVLGSLVPFLCHAQVGEIYPSRATMITGECESDLKPTAAVISGGVVDSALKPTAAVAQLDKQLALIRDYVQQNHGVLKELERPVTTTGIWDRLGLWTVAAVVLVGIAYGYPLFHLLAHPRYGSPPFQPF